MVLALPFNVLLTSVGRRSYLVDYFRHAIGDSGLVVGANSVADCSGMWRADIGYEVPWAWDERYVPRILGICRRHDIQMVLSLHDWEAPFLARSIRQFENQGIQMCISSSEILEKCLDKYHTYEFCQENDLECCETFAGIEAALDAIEDRRLEFPLIVKPRIGEGSRGIFVVRDMEELLIVERLLLMREPVAGLDKICCKSAVKGCIVQPYYEAEEYGIEVLNDLNGRFVTTFAKRKLSMRAGETDVAVTVDDDALADLGLRLGTALGHIGLLDVDVLKIDGTYRILEMNARFGGQYPFTHCAGADVPSTLVAWAKGQEPEPDWLYMRPGVTMSKSISMVERVPGD